jgi:Flp pilus assembly protein TadG
MATPVLTCLMQRGRDRWAAYRRGRSGSAAVEFAMIAAPFFFLILGLIEVCMIFIMSTILENAVQETARPIRTGAVQSGGINAVEFKNAVCAELLGLMDCDNNLHVDVRTLTNFGAGVPPSAIDADGNLDTSAFTYQLGGPNDIVSVRVFYEWGLITPLISRPLSNLSGNKHLLSSSTVFRTEPYSS